jgi:hypothetical protein
MACSTIWNSMPNTIMPIAAATIGRRIRGVGAAQRAMFSGEVSAHPVVE